MKPLALRSGGGIQTTSTEPSSSAVALKKPAATTTPVAPRPPPPVDAVDHVATTTVVTRQAGSDGVPGWASPAYFTTLANAGDDGKPTAGLKGGGGLQVRLAAMQTPKKSPATTTTTPATTTAATDERRERGRGLLARAMHDVGVIGGRPMTAAEIAEAPAALHITKPKAVASILSEGLRPTTGLYKNLTTWFRDAVYMFGREPTAYQKFVNFSTAASAATATIEIDLKKLDPQKLYKRVLDGAIIYVSDTPIPKEALRLREAGR